MARHLSDSGFVLPVIRKVICRDGSFICSICRSEYETKIEANNCLNTCWLDVQDLYPIVLRKLNQRKVAYRCHFCCRDHDEESSALSCARRCLNARNKQHIKEQLVNDLPIVTPVRKSSRLRLIILRPPAAVAKSSKASKEQNVANSSPVPIAADSVSTLSAKQAGADPIIAKEIPIDKRRSKASFTKQWIRNDARYQCKFCNSLFFTKMETETCFHSHFDEQGLEILTDT